MYARVISRKNKDGSVVEYVQLAHNVRHPGKRYAQAEVIYSFGRKDQLDLNVIRRLIASLSRFLKDDAALSDTRGDDFQILSSKPHGGVYLLNALWSKLGLLGCLDKALKGREYSAPMAQAVFAMVANRALAPCSKLAIETWATKDVHLDPAVRLQAHHFYRAMDFLLENEESLQREVFWSLANLLNLEVDLVFFDTTNVYFETEKTSDIKRFGHSKEKRDDLPLVTIGLAVTRDGLPVRCWVFPGNQSDMKTVETVQRDLAGWSLGRVVWVMDRGMASEENKRILQRAGGHYILGEKLRGSSMAGEVLSRPGRYRAVDDNLHIKEIQVGEGLGRKRFVLVKNPAEAERDRQSREELVRRLEDEIQSIAALQAHRRQNAVCKLSEHAGMKRFLSFDGEGAPSIDRAKVHAEERLDGKYLLSTSSPDLPAEDVALGYKQLLEVERAFRTLKTTLDLRPVYHSRDDRIRSHVLLCWLALLLARMAEVKAGISWDRIRQELDRLHMVEIKGACGHVLKRTELTEEQRRIFKALDIKPPRAIDRIDPDASDFR